MLAIRTAPSCEKLSGYTIMFVTPEIQGIRLFGLQKKGGVYTVEVRRSYRAIARERNGEYDWLWIGTHEVYNNFRF
jgi:hypothetical protein